MCGVDVYCVYGWYMCCVFVMYLVCGVYVYGVWDEAQLLEEALERVLSPVHSSDWLA